MNEPKQVLISLPKKELESILQAVKDLQNAKVTWDTNPLKMAHEAISSYKTRLGLLEERLTKLLL